ncbi:MAG: signal recognition particle receptor subunit alpha [archaeon]
MLSKIKEVLSKITKAPVVDEALVNDIVRDIQRVMISSDMNIQLVQKLSNDIKKQAIDEKLPPGVSRKEHLIKLIYDELVKIIGKGTYSPRMERHSILLVGLYGSGKTTTAGKLAKFYMKRGMKVCLISTDTWRPAAFEQLRQVGESIKAPVFGNPEEKDSVRILKDALKKAEGYDIVIVDSAGRDSLNEELIDEIRVISEELKPAEKFLVISSDIGQTAFKQADEFNKAVGLTGVIATKADSSGKAGGALSACYAANVPVAFIGTGEKADDFEVFDADKFVSRLLGFADVSSLVSKMKEAVEEAEFDPEDLMKKEYNLKTFYKQLEATRKMGPMKKVIEMMGLGAMPEAFAEQSEEKMKRFKVIMDSMTPQELEEPELIKSSRIKRIAAGSGSKESDVRELLHQFEASRKMLKKLKSGKMKNLQGMMRRFQSGGFKM